MRIIIRDLKHWRTKRDALTIGILSLVVVVLWISIEVYKTYTETTVTSNVSQHLEPLSPSIDNQAIEELKNRFYPPDSFSIVTSSPDVPAVTDQEEISPTPPSASPSGATQ
jgi:hypothetical protein